MHNLLNEYPELNITVKAGDLKEMAEYIVRLTREELELQIAEAKTETYLSRDEVSNMLGVDKSTLWRWNKQGYLPHIEIGSKRKYRKSDVKRILRENEYDNN